MLFVEWWLVREICVGLLLVAVPAFTYWFVRNKRGPFRITVRIFSALVAVCGVLGWLVFLLFPWPHFYSVPVYSPNRRMAARIDDYNAGGFGGAYNSVELFTLLGLKSEVVYSGEWDSVGPNDLRWKSDAELEILYKGPTCECKSTRRVLVRCIRQQSLRDKNPTNRLSNSFLPTVTSD
jgi:hypothetical protein